MKKILVIGDSCKDKFIYCDTLRLAPDLPVPVLNVKNEIENPGMAMNVYRSIEKYLPNVWIETNENWESCVKTRYVHDETNHMFFRVDSNDSVSRIDIKKINYNYDIIVISDYNKGFLTEQDIELICNNHNNVFVDTKKILGSWANKAAVIKINDKEYKNSLPYITEELDRKIIHTLGSGGCLYRNKKYPVNKVEVKDASGAGDTFMASLVIKYYQTGDLDKSIIFANACASEVVKHRGVTIA